MVFSGLVFLFLYLPIVIGIYYLTPRPFRNGFLMVANIVFYGWGEPVFLSIMLLSILCNYVFGLLIERYRQDSGKKKLFLILSVVVSLGLLGLFKYTNFIMGILEQIPLFSQMAAGVPLIPLPIGISFYTFQVMSYAVDVYRGDTKAQKNIITFASYVSLFPQLIAGPIVRYKDVEAQLISRRENLAQFASGIRLFVIGLSKKVLIANQMGLLWDSLRPTAAENGLIGVWAGVLAYTLQIYFDFSGYSDMARGLGRMFGLEFLENFNYPYISKSITEFWRRWHISLSSWFRDYVYIPLGGNRKGVSRQIVNLLIVWALTGLWHGASWNFVLWGLYYFAFLVVEKFLLKGILSRLPSGLSHAYALIVIMVGWVLFYFEDMGELGQYLGLMFSGESGLLSLHAMSLLTSYGPLLFVSALACVPYWAGLYEKNREKAWMSIAEPVVCAVLMLLCTASLVSQAYNPFLYFRF